MVLHVDDELSRVVVESNASLTSGTSPEVPNLYSRDLAGGAYRLRTPIGPTYMDAIRALLFYNADAGSVFMGASSDGGQVLFNSVWPYTPDAPPMGPGNRLYLAGDAGVDLVGVLPDGTVPETAYAGSGLFSTDHAVSEDGRRVYFTTNRDGFGPLYLREGGETEAIVDDPDQIATFYAATPDGSRMLYRLTRNLGQPGDQGLFLYDAETGTSEFLSVDSQLADGVSTGSDMEAFAASEDLGRVYFTARGALVDGQAPIGETFALYLWDHGVIEHVATLNDDQDYFPGPRYRAYSSYPGSNTWIERPDGGRTADGRVVVFRTTARVTDDETGGFHQIYRYETAGGELECLSCPADGPATAASSLYEAHYLTLGRTGPHSRPLGQGNALSADGERVFFSTRQALVAGDVNNRLDAYVWEDGQVSLISDGVSPFDAAFVDASASGDDAFFATRNRLIAADTDDLVDLYDARVGGGFPEPEGPPSGCTGDGCQGQPSDGPGGRRGGSNALAGAGNVSVPRAGVGLRRLTAAQRSALVAGSRIRVRLTVTRPGRVGVTVRGRIGGRARLVASGQTVAAKAGVVSVGLRLSSAARRQLRRRGALRVVVVARLGSKRSSPVGLRLTSSSNQSRAHGR